VYPRATSLAQGYDLSVSRYAEVVRDELEHRPPLEIIAELEMLESEIQHGLTDLTHNTVQLAVVDVVLGWMLRLGPG